MSEFEKIPKDDAREVDDASHERITFLLYALDYIYGKHNEEAQDYSYQFHCTEYKELQSLYGYESVIVGVGEGLVMIEVTQFADDGESRKDFYTYCPEDRSLRLQTTIEYDNENLDSLGTHLIELSAQAHQHQQAASEAYDMLVNGLRNTKEWAGIFRQYDEISEKIGQKMQEAFDSDDGELFRKLEVSRLENEAITLDFLTKLAEIDMTVADLLHRYQYSAQVGQAIEAQMAQLIVKISEEESTTLPAISGKSSDFIALLDMVSKLKSDER